MTVKLSGAAIAEKHAKNLKAAGPYITAGVNAVTESPMQKAAANLDKARQNYIAAIDSGKTARRLNETPLQDWKDGMIKKGIGRIAAGVDKSLPKTTAFFEKLVPHIEAGQNKIKGMPNLTIDDSAERMVTFMKHMHEFQR